MLLPDFSQFSFIQGCSSSNQWYFCPWYAFYVSTKELCWRVKTWSATARMKTTLANLQLWFYNLAACVFKTPASRRHLACNFSKVTERAPSSYHIFSSAPCVWRWSPKFANILAPFQNDRPSETHQPKTSIQDCRDGIFLQQMYILCVQ